MERIAQDPLARHKGNTSTSTSTSTSTGTSTSTNEPKESQMTVAPVYVQEKPKHVPTSTHTAHSNSSSSSSSQQTHAPSITTGTQPNASRGSTNTLCSGTGSKKISDAVSFDIFVEDETSSAVVAPASTKQQIAMVSSECKPTSSQSSNTKTSVVIAPSTSVLPVKTLNAAKKSAQPFAIFSESFEDVDSHAATTTAAATAKLFTGVSSPAVTRVTKTMQKQHESSVERKPASIALQPPAPLSFDIFSDEGAVASPVVAMQSTTRPTLSLRKPMPGSTSVIASKSSVLQSVSNSLSSAAMPKTGSNTGFAVFQSPHHTKPSFSTPQATISPSADVHEDELDHILAEMGVMDDEDGTINTRLAKRDIDSMFCSPGNSLLPSSSTTTSKKPYSHQAASDFTSNKKRRSKEDEDHHYTSSPKVLTLRSYVGGTMPSAQLMASGSQRVFGGSDLSAIQEVYLSKLLFF